jgi:hypothetical protein
MPYDLRRGPPADMRVRRGIGAGVAWSVAMGAMLLASALDLPPGSAANIVCALLAAGGMLAAVVTLLLARATPRGPPQPGAVLHDDGESLVVVTDLGVEPVGVGVVVFLAGMAIAIAGAKSFVNRAHVADAILGSAIANAAIAAFAARAFGPTLVRVDAEGVAIARGGRVRLVPWSEVREIAADPGSLAIVRLDGARVRLAGPTLAAAERARLEGLLEAGLAAVTEPLPDRTALLARGGRPIAEWRRALARVVEREGYRSRGLSLEEAEAVLAAARAPASLRIGAAMAIAASGEPRGAERIRAVAADCPDPRLGAALRAAAEEEPSERVIDRALGG